MPLPTDLAEAHALILRQREELAAAEARASGAETMIPQMKLVIVKLRCEQYGQSSEPGRKVLDQLELQLEELETETSENAVTAEETPAGTAVKSFTRRRPVRAPLPAHLPRERVVIPAPCACPVYVYGGRLAKLGEDIAETLEIVPRQHLLQRRPYQSPQKLLVCCQKGFDVDRPRFTLLLGDGVHPRQRIR